MNSRIWLGCLFMFTGGCLRMQGQEATQILKATPAQVDFGTLHEGVPAKATATVINTGKTRVEIQNVRTN